MKYIFMFSCFVMQAIAEVVTPVLSLSLLELNPEIKSLKTSYNSESITELQYIPHEHKFKDILGNQFAIDAQAMNMSGLCGSIQVYDSYIQNETVYGYIVKYSDCETIVCPGVLWQAGTSNLCIYQDEENQMYCKDFTQQNNIVTLMNCILQIHSFTNMSIHLSLKPNKHFEENPYVIAVGILLVCFCILLLMKCSVYTFLLQEDRMVLA